jgi:hypothetical protein
VSRGAGRVALCCAWLVANLAILVPPAVAGPPATPSAVHVDTRPSRLEAVLGDTVTVRSTVTNARPAATTSLIAHLDVVSLGRDVYVDPEDWSSERSVEVEPLPPGGTAELSWPIRTVDSGDFAVYVVLMPAGRAGPAPLTASPPVHLTVAGRRALTAGGTVPVDIGVPFLLALAILSARLRRRRSAAAAP